MKRYLFILQFDSFVKTLLPIIHRLREDNQVDILLYRQRRKRNWVDENIRELLSELPYEEGFNPALYRLLVTNYDVAVVSSTGARFITYVSKFLAKHQLKTRLATGYVGLLLQNHPRGFIKGAMRRSFTQLIWTPGQESRARVLNTGFMRPEFNRVKATGLPRFDEFHEKVQAWSERTGDQILFIEQPTFPESREERARLVEILAAIARAYPQYSVVIKPRFSSKVGHAHRPKHLLPELIGELNDAPENLTVSEEDLYEQFRRSAFALSISSTGAIEALLAGIPSYFLNDFCGSENRYGSNDFQALGNVVTGKDIIAGELPEIEQAKVTEFLRFDGMNTVRLVQALQELAESQAPQYRRSPLRIKFRYHGIRAGSILQARHERRPEQIAAWANHNVALKRGPMAGGIKINYGAKEGISKDSELALAACPDRLDSWPGVKGTESSLMVYSFYYCLGSLLSSWPQRWAGQSSPLLWELEEQDALRQQIQQQSAILQSPAMTDFLQSAWENTRLRSGVIRLHGKAELQLLDHFPGTSVPKAPVSTELADQLREQRAELERDFASIYALMDQTAWYSRFFQVLAENLDD